MSINADATLTQMQNNTNLVNYMSGRANLGTGKMDRQGFIQLILAQLQYQDPTNPQDSSQMLSQQLQLQQADDSTAMVNATKFSQAATMVGKVATLPDGQWDFTNNVSKTPDFDVTTGQPATVTGTIESVQFDQAHGKALVKINGNYYDADKIKSLSAASLTNTSTMSQASALVGKQVSLLNAPWDFNTNSSKVATSGPATVSGTISDMKFDPVTGTALVNINGNYYNAASIQNLSTLSTLSAAN